MKNLFKNKSVLLIFLTVVFEIGITSIILLLPLTVRPIEANITPLKTTIQKETSLNEYDKLRIEILVLNEIETMSEQQKIGQLFMLSIPGTYVSASTQSLIEEYYVGNIVLMGANVASTSQIIELNSNLRNLSKTPLLIATDQEGGVVARIPWDEARNISTPHIGLVGRDDFAYEIGKQHADALKVLDIDMNLAPVLDIAFVSNSAMSSRSFGSSPESVSSLGKNLILGMQQDHVIACGKHFPGIGRTSIDTHKMLPTIDISKETLLKEELLPYQQAIEANVGAIMVGHALYPQIDFENPSSLSSIIITDILRDELGYNGVVISDDIQMGALDNFPGKAIQSLIAGADVLLIVDSYDNQVKFITQVQESVRNNQISQQSLDESVKRVLRLKYTFQVLKSEASL